MKKIKKTSRLEILRKSLGLTQEELGRAAGITQARVAQVEAGDFSPKVLKKLAAALNYLGDYSELKEWIEV